MVDRRTQDDRGRNVPAALSIPRLIVQSTLSDLYHLHLVSLSDE